MRTLRMDPTRLGNVLCSGKDGRTVEKQHAQETGKNVVLPGIEPVTLSVFTRCHN